MNQSDYKPFYLSYIPWKKWINKKRRQAEVSLAAGEFGLYVSKQASVKDDAYIEFGGYKFTW